MVSELDVIEGALRTMLPSLPQEPTGAVSDAAAQKYGELRAAQARWEGDLGLLLDDVSKLQSPSQRRGLGSHARTGP